MIDGCGRVPYSRGWCEKHYRRWLRTGDPTAWDHRPSSCTVDACDNDVDAHGLCHGHYQRLLRDGDVRPQQPLSRRRQPERCTIDDCHRATHSKGLCRTHRKREERHGDPLPDVPVAELVWPETCAVRTCDAAVTARSLCEDHYISCLRGESPAGVEPRGTPEGGGWLTHGYVGVPVPAKLQPLVGDSSVTEHRLVMAVKLGRPLTSDDVVHHRNGDRRDNRPGNLELWSVYHPKGQRVEDKVAYAVEILARHRPWLLASDGRATGAT